MQSDSGNRRFRPGVLPTLAVLALVPVFVALGNWQLDRAQQKRERVAQFEDASSRQTMTALMAARDAAPAGFTHVRAEGRYASELPQVLLEGMSHRGRAGYHVLTPLRAAEGPLVLINRGWIERDFASAGLPAVPAPEREAGTLEGVLKPLPRPGMRLEQAASPALDAEVVSMLYPQVAQLEALYGEPVFDGMVLLSPEMADGFLRDWSPDVAAPTRHIAYAVQWFAFAGTLVLLYVLLNFRRADDGTARRARAERIGSGTA